MLVYTTLNNKGTIKSDYLDETIYNLLDKTFELPKDGFSYKILNVTNKYIARPDLISLDAYGDTMYADVICKINGISNPFHLNAGMQLILPTPDSIMDFVIRPSAAEKENDNHGYTLPKAKRPNEKRKPNEALVGDKRFRIDKNSGIIIY